jgi:hypothetical protein
MRPLYRIIELELAEELRPGTRRDGPIPAPEHLTGQIGPGHAGAHPSLSHRLLARGARRARVPRDVAN